LACCPRSASQRLHACCPWRSPTSGPDYLSYHSGDAPIPVRISCSDWAPRGWDIDESVRLASILKGDRADLVDCSSGGNIHSARVPAGPGYLASYAERIRRDARIPTACVGFITSPQQADQLPQCRQADLVVLARQPLREPCWPLRAAAELREETAWPDQYLRAKT
jgi:2,4-dienoyl-CoA reductase-like NADH-dependent reductase (Old Yellow Enzyme family)